MSAPVRIAAVLPITGAEAIFGRQGLQGARMAVAEINDAGGVLGGRPLELVVHDCRTALSLTEQVTRDALADDAVIAVLGPTTSVERDLMLPLCADARTPLLYATDYEGGACSRYLFAYSPIPDHYVTPLVPHLVERSGPVFGMVGNDYVWPTTIGAAFAAQAAAHGARMVAQHYVPMGTSDFATVLRDLSDREVTTVCVALVGSDGQAFLDQFAASDLHGHARLAVMAFNENYMTGMAAEAVEDVITCVPFLSTLDRPETRSFVERQRTMFGADTVVGYLAESHYGIVAFLRSGIEAAGSDDREAVIDAMGDRTLVVGNGSVTLRATDHHMVLNMVIASVRGGRLLPDVYVGPVVPGNQCAGKAR